ncbi:hypothetical protein FJMB80182_24620 [Enterobacter hormaechei]|nr:hypothetical protein FJMB80178_24480 [Enterobacter hormaechei]BDK82612.1 hypothetical protein FJMB80182_24620 [Enterobacter hormaechei]BDL18950.1 hypothetical protein FJMB80378_23910 [Enterobacter hormaechei]BDL24178.1 hypothetical protein FJMB80380_23910 [Enterobacter hormaechei]GKX02810.1 hypothetical protein FJMB80057_24730 [Enterobacter hormaechei]
MRRTPTSFDTTSFCLPEPKNNRTQYASYVDTDQVFSLHHNHLNNKDNNN